jgi:PAS domain S-box-containing protein
MNAKKIDFKQFEKYSKQELANYIEKLELDLEEAKEKNQELELLLDFITEVTTGLENEIHVKNKEMSIYIEQVKEVTKAAIAVENDTFEPNCLDGVASRDDPLGTLARVFQSMVNNLKARERQLAEAKGQLEAVLNAVPGTVSWIGANGFYIGVNQHLAQTLNLSPDDFVGKQLNFLQSSPEFARFINQFINSSQNYISTEVPLYQNGRLRYYLMVAQKYNENKALVSVGIDITERKKAQQDLELQRNSFARFVPSEYLKFLGYDDIVSAKLGDNINREVSVLFSDIRSFTSLSENMTPQEIFDFINSYLGRVSPAIRSHNGFIMKYIGDCIMAAFPNTVSDAVNAGIAHIEKVKEYNKETKKQINIGIGIHIGYITVGILGEPQRLQADALSDSVNLAARLEGLTKIYGSSILISDAVVSKLKNANNYRIRFLDNVIVKGRQKVTSLYEVLDAEEEKAVDFKLKTQKDFDRALQFYQKGEWAEAQDYFQKVLNTNAGDKVALLYLDRIETLKNQVHVKTWDGVWHFSQK